MRILFMIDPIAIPDLSAEPKLLDDFIIQHASEITRYTRLKNYYDGKHDILNKTQADATQPNNRVVINFCKLATTTKTGYFAGKSNTLTIPDEKHHELIMGIDSHNDSHAKNMELAKNASIHGIAYEVVYATTDEDTGLPTVRYAQVKPSEMFIVYSNDIEPKMLYAVRYYMLGNDTKVEIYSKNGVKYMTKAGNKYRIDNEIAHYFMDVPAVVYRNNSSYEADYEQIMTIQDDFNEKVSDVSNELSYFREAILKIINMSGTTKEDMEFMRENKAIMLADGGDVDWVVKPMTKEVPEFHLKMLKDSAFMIACFPNWSDEAFSGNLSGVAIRFKLLNLEQICSETEASFKAGFKRRYRLITNFLNKLGHSFTMAGFDIKFNRNLPSNIVETADIISKLRNIVSDETLLSLLPFIDDIKAELDRVKAQTEGELSTADMQSVLSKYTDNQDNGESVA